MDYYGVLLVANPLGFWACSFSQMKLLLPDKQALLLTYVNPAGCVQANRDPPMQLDMIAIGKDKVLAASA